MVARPARAGGRVLPVARLRGRRAGGRAAAAAPRAAPRHRRAAAVELHWRVHWYERASPPSCWRAPRAPAAASCRGARRAGLAAAALRARRLRRACGWRRTSPPGGTATATSSSRAAGRALRPLPGAGARVARRLPGLRARRRPARPPAARRPPRGRAAARAGRGAAGQLGARGRPGPGVGRRQARRRPLQPRGERGAVARRQLLPGPDSLRAYYGLPEDARVRLWLWQALHPPKMLARFGLALARARLSDRRRAAARP